MTKEILYDCSKCNGVGTIKVTRIVTTDGIMETIITEKENEENIFHWLENEFSENYRLLHKSKGVIICPKCAGDGKVNWLENIFGRIRI